MNMIFQLVVSIIIAIVGFTIFFIARYMRKNGAGGQITNNR